MKIATGKYLCGWCGIILNHQRKTVNMNNKQSLGSDLGTPGRHTVTSVLKCPKCNNAISQKTVDGLR